MRTFQQKRNYNQLEQLSPQVGELVGLKLKGMWQAFVNYWYTPAGEPRIQQKSDRAGNKYWRVCDPASDRTIRFDDRQELTIWLDERHYRKSQPNLWNISD